MPTLNDLEEQEALRGIARVARWSMEKFKPTTSFAAGSQQKPFPRHFLTIPQPQPITNTIIARGLNPLLAERLNRTYLDKASSLKALYEDKYREVVKTWLDGGSSRLQDVDRFILASQTAYTLRYISSLKNWQVKMDEICQAHMKSQRSLCDDNQDTGVRHGPERRPAFKNGNVHILENAFTINAYPSRMDKEGLAEETGMEYKQINIWFQNRRARSKKEGLSLQRTSTFATQLHSPAYTSTAKPHPWATCEHYGSSETIPVDLPKPHTNLLTLMRRPAHTFPTPYPPLYDADPFPVSTGAGSFQIPWLRTCATDLPQRSVPNIEQLTAQMTNLTLSDGTSTIEGSLPTFALVLPRAPLPALIRTAIGSSCAEPLATLVSATRSPSSKWKESGVSRKAYLPFPTRRVGSNTYSPVAGTQPVLIPRSPALGVTRPRRSETRRSPPPYSRSPSASSVASSCSTSSSWSASSVGLMTPVSTSPRIPFTKDTSSPSSLADVYRSSDITNGVYISSSID